MDNITSVAISSGVAAVISIFSIYVKPSRQKRLSVEVEKLKFELEQQRIDKDFARQRHREAHEAVEQALMLTQKIRDSMLTLSLSDKDFNAVSIELLDHLSADIAAYTDLYARTFPKLDEFEKEVLHHMKSLLFNVRTLFFSYEKRTVEAWDKMEFLTCLMDFRSELFMFQQKLLWHRQRILLKSGN